MTMINFQFCVALMRATHFTLPARPLQQRGPRQQVHVIWFMRKFEDTHDNTPYKLTPCSTAMSSSPLTSLWSRLECCPRISNSRKNVGEAQKSSQAKAVNYS
jgi:hypothetical protein